MKHQSGTINIKDVKDVKTLSQYLGIGLSSAYCLVRRPDFIASIKIGRRIILNYEALQKWLIEEGQKPFY